MEVALILVAMPLPIRRVRLRRGDQRRLLQVTRARTAAHRVVERAQIVLASAAGESGSAMCQRLNVSRPTVTLWLVGLKVQPLLAALTL